MISLKIDEAEVPITEQTLRELLASLEEMKVKGLTKCRVSSPYSKTTFLLSLDNGKNPMQYSMRTNDHTEHA